MRRHLLANLPGDSAFKHGRPKSKAGKIGVETREGVGVSGGDS